MTVSQSVRPSILAYSYHSSRALSEILFSGGLRDKNNEHNFFDTPTFPKEHQFCWMISRIIPFVVTVRLPLELEICTEH